MNDYEGIMNRDSCGDIDGALRRLVGHPVVLHLVNGQSFRGLVLNVIGNAVRLITSNGCKVLIPFLHISAVREPQLEFSTRCIGRGDCDSND